MTKLTLFIEAYKLGNVASLLDGKVFAQFKAHLQTADGEAEEEADIADDEEEQTLEDDEEAAAPEAQPTVAHEQDHEDSDGEHAETTSAAPAEHDGEWEDEEEHEEDFEEDEFEDEDEVHHEEGETVPAAHQEAPVPRP